jgi:hypothetical protein
MRFSRFLRLLSFTAIFILGAATVNAQSGATVFVPEEATVRAGPSTVYDRLGQFTAEQTAPAVGRSIHSDWIQIEFAGSPNGRGWVYAPFVELRGATLDSLPIADAPPTPTLPPTPEGELNPFIGVTPPPVRQPTFTPAPAVEISQYTETALPKAPFPPASLVLSLLAVTGVGIVMAIIRRNA